jgi:MFS family permease
MSGTLGWSYSLNLMNDALDTVVLLLNLEEPYLGLKEGIVVSSLIVGAFFGCLISFKLLPALPRRRSFQIVDFGFIIGSLMSLVPDVYLMVTSRFIQGISCGIASILVPLTLKEISPIEIFSIIGGQNLVL